MIEKYKEFFSWLFDKDVEIYKEFDIATEKNVYYTEEFKSIIETEQMQRLKKIMQLSTVILENDNAYHTRYDHSIGTYNNGLTLFMSQYEDDMWKKDHESKTSKLDVTASLIELLTHDLGHLTFSHTLEELIGKRGTHEELTERLVQEKLNEVISKIDPRLLEIIQNHRDRTTKISTIEDGNVDLDRMDYLLHDAIYLDEDGNIASIMDRILKGTKLQTIDGNENIPVFKDDVVEDVQKFLEFRKSQYEKYYNSNRGLANDILCVNFCKIAYGKKDQIPEEFYEFLSECINNKRDLELDKHTNWNDLNTINSFLDIIEQSDDKDLVELAIQCTPSLDGMINIVYKMVDFPEEVDGKNPNLEELIPDPEERKIYSRIKHYVKDKNLTDKEKRIKEELMDGSKTRLKSKVVSFNSEDEFNNFKKEIDSLAMPNDVTEQIMWNKKLKKYSFKSPTYAFNENGELIEIVNHPKFKMNMEDEYIRGAFLNKALLRQLNIPDEKIEKMEKICSKFQEDRRSVKKDKHTSKVLENEDMYYKERDEER